MKKRFRFRLQRILQFRETEKNERARLLAERNRELFDANTRLDDILQAQEGANPPEEQAATMAEFLLQGDYQARLREALIEQRLLVLEAAKAVEDAREAYIEKSRETESLERVKAKRREIFEEEKRHDERKEQDNLTVQRYRLKKS